MEFLYLAALKAVAAMADANGDAAFAADCRAPVAKGSVWTEQNLHADVSVCKVTFGEM